MNRISLWNGEAKRPSKCPEITACVRKRVCSKNSDNYKFENNINNISKLLQCWSISVWTLIFALSFLACFCYPLCPDNVMCQEVLCFLHRTVFMGSLLNLFTYSPELKWKIVGNFNLLPSSFLSCKNNDTFMCKLNWQITSYKKISQNSRNIVYHIYWSCNVKQDVHLLLYSLNG